ncbi:substrate-binding periplasmic protein [Endozoicomonas euniceicola]|uniref:Transporter substrate-binding domain-containing protein n=1 Tax=Endozoicomonas euniceicola TaxID=1234143 RepID=A0ABY6GQ21_9GAMM|nr:transporter substrate-binding domain-containing protein [Endozoicomonas euniceicola]UYM14790.1 transporter substrate-binding domain-containing protein [Endozoicomonas euniceicola]
MYRLPTLIIAVLFSASAFSSQSAPITSDAIEHDTNQRETLLVGLFPQDYPPLYWHDERKGIIEKLLDKVSSVSRFDFIYKSAPFHRLIQRVAKGKIDLEPWSSQVWRFRVKDSVYFTSPYAEHCEVIIFQKGHVFPVSQPADLAGKRLGVVKGFVYNSFTELFAKKTIYRVNSSNEERVLNLLNHGRTDAALIDQLVADYLLSTTYPQTFTRGGKFDCVPVSFMFSKTKIRQGMEISKVLQTLKNEGFIDQLLEEF